MRLLSGMLACVALASGCGEPSTPPQEGPPTAPSVKTAREAAEAKPAPSLTDAAAQDRQKEAPAEGQAKTVDDWIALLEGDIPPQARAEAIQGLIKAGWQAPEVFVAKARDGLTDIWGIISRPMNFDSNKKYPVVEYIYAGPH